MPYFENKAEYLKWAKKKESRRIPKAATKESPPENLGIFHKAKIRLIKSPISWIFPILGVVLILSLYSLNSGKGQNPGPGKESTSNKTEWSPPGPISQPVKLQNLDLGKVDHLPINTNAINIFTSHCEPEGRGNLFFPGIASSLRFSQ